MLVIKSKGSYFIVKKSPRDTDINNLHSIEQIDSVKNMKNADLMDQKHPSSSVFKSIYLGSTNKMALQISQKGKILVNSQLTKLVLKLLYPVCFLPYNKQKLPLYLTQAMHRHCLILLWMFKDSFQLRHLMDLIYDIILQIQPKKKYCFWNIKPLQKLVVLNPKISVIQFLLICSF